jgi:hypothetical protein
MVADPLAGSAATPLRIVVPTAQRQRLDARQHRWGVLYSADPEYAALFAPAAHTLDLDTDSFICALVTKHYSLAMAVRLS